MDNLSSSLSNQMDPIAELLSQLTGVRRAATSSNSTNNQLQQLQAQLNRERESLQQQSAAAAVIAAATANGQSTGPSTRHHHLHHHLFSGSGLGNYHILQGHFLKLKHFKLRYFFNFNLFLPAI